MKVYNLQIFSRQNYQLLRELVISDFKVRYQGSVLGYLWSLLKPLGLFTILYIVFAKFFRFGDFIPHFPAYLLLGIVVWTFFAEATMAGMQAIVDRSDLIRKVRIPTYIIVLSTVFSASINLFINLGVVMGFMAFTGADVSAQAILFIPLLLIELFILSIAASFLLSALYVKYRDMTYIWELGQQLLFYGTPIIYPLSIVPDAFKPIVLANPLAQIVQDMRYFLVTPETTTSLQVLGGGLWLVPFTLVVAVAVVATWYFKVQAKTFAENV